METNLRRALVAALCIGLSPSIACDVSLAEVPGAAGGSLTEQPAPVSPAAVPPASSSVTAAEPTPQARPGCGLLCIDVLPYGCVCLF